LELTSAAAKLRQVVLKVLSCPADMMATTGYCLSLVPARRAFVPGLLIWHPALSAIPP